MDTPRLQLHIDGQRVEVNTGCTVAAALYAATGVGIARISITGEARAPFCGMGVCHECRVWIDGRPRLACQTLSAAGMRVETTR